MRIAESPKFGPITKEAALYRKAVQAQHLVADDIVMTDEEIKAKPQQPPIDALIAQAEAETRLKLESMSNETDITVAQIRSNDNSIKVQVDAEKTQLQEDNKANLFMAEKQIKEQYGEGI